MMQERAVEVDPSTIMRWVHRYAPELEKRARSYQGCRATSWRVNETYVNVGGKWKYLFCAVDKHGRLIDFMLSDRRPVVPNTFLASSACERSAGHQTLKAFCGWAIDGSMMLRKFADEVWKPSIFPSLKLSTRIYIPVPSKQPNPAL